MNPKTIDHVCSRLVYVFHWRNVGSKDRIDEIPLCASLAGPRKGIGNLNARREFIPGIVQSDFLDDVFGRDREHSYDRWDEREPRKVPPSGESPEWRSRFNALVKMLFVILAEDRR